jgi:hypothetical protein
MMKFTIEITGELEQKILSLSSEGRQRVKNDLRNNMIAAIEANLEMEKQMSKAQEVTVEEAL